MSEEERLLREAKKLLWEDRLLHKNWKVRSEANINLASLCDASIADTKDPRLCEFVMLPYIYLPEIRTLKEQLIACKTYCIETETRKAELETNLATNLKRRKQEFEVVISSSETYLHENEAESKWQELKDAESLVIDATQRLEGINRSIEETNKEIKKIKDEMAKLKALEDNYEKTLQDETKELEQLFSRRNALIAKQDEYSKKIRNLGPLPSDAFETVRIGLEREATK